MQVDTGEIGTGFVVRGTGSTQLVTRNCTKIKGFDFFEPFNFIIFQSISYIVLQTPVRDVLRLCTSHELCHVWRHN